MFGKNKTSPEEKLLDKQLNHSTGQTDEQLLTSMALGGNEQVSHPKDLKADLTRWQQDLSEDLQDMLHDLRREEFVNGSWQPIMMVGYDKDDNIILDDMGKPQGFPAPAMLNDNGIYRIISITKRFLNKNTMMSNLNEKDINRMLRNLKTTLVYSLCPRYDEFGIEKNDISSILMIVTNCAEFTVKRALNNGERKHLETIRKMVEAYMQRPELEQKKKGMFSGLMGG